MSRGGIRAGSGRPGGSLNKKTLEIVKKTEETGLTPVEYLLSVMRDPGNSQEIRIDAANKVAPYIHSKLSSMILDAQISTHESALDELD